MGLFVRLQLAREFGIGSNPEKQKFLEENGGYKGLRNTLAKGGFSALGNKVKSFKNNGRPGQNPENKPDAKNNPNAPKDPKANDKTKPNADQEWSKKNDDEKLSLLKKDSKQFKEFEAKNKADAIKEINETFDKKDLAKLRGIVDKALEGQKLSPKEKLAAFGLVNKDEFIFAGKADKDGVFGLYKASDNKTNDANNPFAKITIGDKGELSFTKISPKPEAQKPETQKPEARNPEAPKPETKKDEPKLAPDVNKAINPKQKKEEQSILEKPDQKPAAKPELKSILEK